MITGPLLTEVRKDLQVEWQPEARPDVLGGITALTNGELTAVPYFACEHRGPGAWPCGCGRR